MLEGRPNALPRVTAKRNIRLAKGQRHSAVRAISPVNAGQQKGRRRFHSISGRRPQSSVRGGKLFNPARSSSCPPRTQHANGTPTSTAASRA